MQPEKSKLLRSEEHAGTTLGEVEAHYSPGSRKRLEDDATRVAGATKHTVEGSTGSESFDYVMSRKIRRLVDHFLSGRWIGGEVERDRIHSYSGPGAFLFRNLLLRPLVRIPTPALSYPAVYPNKVQFSGLDCGLDVLELGRMPADNRYIYRLLWPQKGRGTIMVPFQYAAYSQIGLGGALFVSFLVGWLLAKAWIFLITGSGALEVRAAAASLAVVFAILIASDSLRNSLIVSYGVFWGAGALAVYSIALKRRSAVPKGLEVESRSHPRAYLWVAIG